MSAAERLFEKYCDFLVSQNKYTNKQRPSWSSLEKELKEAFGSTYSGDENYDQDIRLSQYKKLAQWLPEYNEEKWFNDAVETNVKGFKDSHNGILSHLTIFKDEYYWREDRVIQSTDWFKFQEAVKEHERFGIKLLDSIFKQMDVNIGKV